MNIQIFAAKRGFDVQKAERWFKERRIPYQFVDLSKKSMSPRELESVARAVGLKALIRLSDDDWESHYAAQLTDTRAALEMLSQKPALLNTPIVRNGSKATVGYCPDVWSDWT